MIAARLQGSSGWLLLGVALGGLVGLTVLVSPVAATGLFVGLIMALAMYHHPQLIPAVAFVSVLFGNTGIGFQAGIPWTPAKLGVAGGLAIWVAHALMNGRTIFRPNVLTLPLLAIIASQMISVVFARKLVITGGLDELISLVMLVTMVHLIDTVLEREQLVQSLRYSGLVLVAVLATTLVLPEHLVTEDGRMVGVFDNANFWVGVLLISTPLMLAACQADRHWMSGWIKWGLFLLVPIHVFLSLSRTGIVAYLVLLPFMAFILWPQRVRLLLVLAGLALTSASFESADRWTTRFESVFDPAAVDVDGSIRSRSDSYRYGFAVFLERPLTGAGIGTFEHETRVKSSGLVDVQPHNQYARVAAEEGLVGIVAYLWLLVVVVIHILRLVLQRVDLDLRRMGVALAGTLLALMLMAWGFDATTFAPVYVVLGWALAVFRARESLEPVESAPLSSPAKRAAS